MKRTTGMMLAAATVPILLAGALVGGASVMDCWAEPRSSDEPGGPCYELVLRGQPVAVECAMCVAASPPLVQVGARVS